MPDPTSNQTPEGDHKSARLTIPEIVQELSIGRFAVYAMLEAGIIPGRMPRFWARAVILNADQSIH